MSASYTNSDGNVIMWNDVELNYESEVSAKSIVVCIAKALDHARGLDFDQAVEELESCLSEYVEDWEVLL